MRLGFLPSTAHARRMGTFGMWMATSTSTTTWVLGRCCWATPIRASYAPFMNALFDTQPIDAQTWLRITAVGLVAWLIVTADKRVHRGHF